MRACFSGAAESGLDSGCGVEERWSGMKARREVSRRIVAQKRQELHLHTKKSRYTSGLAAFVICQNL